MDTHTALATLGFMSPRLATVNLCTGLVTLGPVLTRPNTANLVVEGLTRHANGTWYVASGNNAQTTLSPNLGTLDTTTGVITSLGGSVTTAQNDIDMLFFKDGTLYGGDVATDVNRTEIYILDLATGVDSNNLLVNQIDEPLRLAWDAARGKLYSWRGGDRNLVTVDLGTGAVTPIGETHPATAYANATVRGFFVAPAPSCP